MRKTFLAIATIAAIFASCSEKVETVQEEITPSQNEKVVLRASVPEADTKVSSDNAGAFAWQIGDKVTVLNTDSTPYEFETEDGGTAVDFSSTTFTGTLSEKAFYPASANHASDKFYLEPNLTWRQDAAFMPMIGTVNPTEMTSSFESVGAVLKLICFNVDKNADNLVITSDSKQIVGEFTPSGNKKTITSVNSDSNNSLTISFEKATSDRNMVFYIPLPSGSVGKLTFTLNNGSTKIFEKTTKAAVSMVRNQVLVAPVLNCAPDILIWSENFGIFDSGDVPSSQSGTNITYSCVDGGTNTKVYTTQIGSGGPSNSPELLVSKTGNNTSGSFTASNIPTSGATSLVLSFYQNNTNLTLSSSTAGVSFGDIISDGNHKTVVVTNSKSATVISITFTNENTSKNVRLDDISLSIPGASFSAPTITPTSTDLEIAIAGGATNSASTTFTYKNGVDDFGVSAVVNGDASEWLTASIEGTTLIVSANKNDTGSDRYGTVTLRASGATATVSVSQPNAKVADPSFSTNGGTFDNNQSITLNCDTEGATIRYTTDGTSPTISTGTEYSGAAIVVSSETTVKAIAYKTDWIDSNVNTQVYAFVVGTPSFDPAAGAIAKGMVNISTTTDGATVYYTTTNDSYPSDNWTSGSSVTVNSAQTIRAIAIKGGYANSEINSAAYTISKVATPTFSPANGAAVQSGSAVTISCETEGAEIHYTTDGSTPTISSATYNSDSKPTISAATTIKAIAVKANWDNSEVGTATYTISAYNTYISTLSSSKWEVKNGSDFSWTDVSEGNGFSNNGIQVLGTGTAYATSNKTFSGVSKVTVTYNTNKSSGSATVKVKVGSNSEKSETCSYSSGDGREANYTKVYSFSPTQSGQIKVIVEGSHNSIYLVKVEVEALSMSNLE